MSKCKMYEQAIQAELVHFIFRLPNPRKVEALCNPQVKMTELRRIALFSHEDRLGVQLLLGLQRGFRQIGVECMAMWKLPRADHLTTFVDLWRPDAVLEIDRTRDQIKGYRDDTPHLAWIQGAQACGVQTNEGYGGSDITYFMANPEAAGFDYAEGDYKWLFPGADESVFNAQIDAPLMFELGMAGHLTPPFSNRDLDRPLLLRGVPAGTVADAVQAYLTKGVRAWGGVDAIYHFLTDYAGRFVADAKLSDYPSDIRRFLEEVVARVVDRKLVADQILAASSNCAFFGGPGWAAWRDLAPYYKGALDRPNELARAYRSTRLNVHNSYIAMHHRTMEVMACGRALMVNHGPFEGTPADITRFFTPGEDFLFYEFDRLAETARHALADPERLDRIGRNAAARISEAHTWRHRAEQISRDFGAL